MKRVVLGISVAVLCLCLSWNPGRAAYGAADLGLKGEAVSPAVETQAENQHYAYRITKWVAAFLHDDGVAGPFAIVERNRFLAISRCGTETVFAKRNETLEPVLREVLPTPSGNPVACTFAEPFGGVKGLLVDRGRKIAYVSYHTRPSAQCLKLAVVRYEFTDRLEKPKLVFLSQPCYPENIAVLTEAGGVFAEKPDGTLFFSVSDFGSHGDPQKLETSYGKIFRYDPKTGASTIFAYGVRNAEGLAWSDAGGGRLYESEHGPRGGDEINLVNKGDNLGWPLGSYGLDYSANTFEDYHGEGGGKHAFGKKPAFAWIPAIAPAGILVYPTSGAFSDWAGNVMVVSLLGKTLFRVGIEGDRGVFAEPVAVVGERMRSVVLDEKGDFWIKADPQVIVRVARVTSGGDRTGPPVPYTDEQVAAGRQLLNAYCAVCHGALLQGASAPALTGPSMSKFNVFSLHQAVQKMPLPRRIP